MPSYIYRRDFRHLHTGVSEHRGISPRTLLQVLKPKDSRIRDHSEEFNHTFNFTNFKVLKNCHLFDLDLTESVLTHKLKPKLNRREGLVQLRYYRKLNLNFMLGSPLYLIHVLCVCRLSFDFPDDRSNFF